jgi:hypothetical protein
VLANFTTDYEAIVVPMILANKRVTRSMNRIEIPETDPHKFTQLIFDKREKTTQWNKDSKWHDAKKKKDIFFHLI